MMNTHDHELDENKVRNAIKIRYVIDVKRAKNQLVGSFWKKSSPHSYLSDRGKPKSEKSRTNHYQADVKNEQSELIMKAT